jgi:SSS family solute:Na+ symporter
MFWFGVFLVMLVWNLMRPWSNESWASYSHFTGISLPVFFAVVTGIWFTWGGLKDMRELFRRLRHQKINPLDDGTVVGDTNLDELQLTADVESGSAPGPTEPAPPKSPGNLLKK